MILHARIQFTFQQCNSDVQQAADLPLPGCPYRREYQSSAE